MKRSIKYSSFMFKGAILAMIALTFLQFQSCKQENIEVASVDESKYKIDENTYAFLVNTEGNLNESTVETDQKSSVGLGLRLNKIAKNDIVANLKFDASLLDGFNKKNATNYLLFPEKLVQITKDGKLSLASGTDNSEINTVDFTVDNTVELNKTYVIPVSSSILSGTASPSKLAGTFFIKVQRVAAKSSTSKNSGMKIISIIEANDTNPLVHTSFRLKNENKPLFDIVVLFSANINFDEATQKPFVYFNDNIKHLLNNRAKYIKPLQDQGTKVILSILGNHDKSGVANLSPASAKIFAQELKNICETYQLDGIMTDDEYSNYQTPVPAGFVTPSNQAAARLYYEIKQAMPNKINLVYAYSRTNNFSGTNAIPEAPAGNYIDYVVNDYYANLAISRFPGVSLSNYAIYSEEYARGYFLSSYGDTYFKRIVANGNKSHMIFAFDPNRSNFSMQLSNLTMMTKFFFNDDLSYNGVVYKKDW